MAVSLCSLNGSKSGANGALHYSALKETSVWMKPPQRLLSTKQRTSLCLCPKATAAVYFRSFLHCSWLLCFCSSLHWRALSILKENIKYRDETVLVIFLIAVCLMIKVTLSSLAKIHTQQDHLDWWSGSECQWWRMRREGSVAWFPGGLPSCWRQSFMYGLYVCEQGCAACVKEAAPPAGSKPEKKNIKNTACWVSRLD